MDTTRIKRVVKDLGARARPKIEGAKQRLGRINGRVTSLVQDQLGACLFGALALGYMVAHLARRQR